MTFLAAKKYQLSFHDSEKRIEKGIAFYSSKPDRPLLWQRAAPPTDRQRHHAAPPEGTHSR